MAEITPDQWFTEALRLAVERNAALKLAGECVLELMDLCDDPLHIEQAKEICNRVAELPKRTR